MNTLTLEELDELGELYSMATPGEWRVGTWTEEERLHLIYSQKEGALECLIARTCFAPQSHQNATLISEMKEKLPALLSLARRQLEQDAGESRRPKIALIADSLTEEEKQLVRDKILECKNEGCWNWTGSKTSDGYARIYIRKQPFLVSRLCLHLFQGKHPRSLFVCHKCDNTMCVNPDHLFLGTHQDNMDDMVQKGRHWKKRKVPTHCRRGHELTEENRYCGNRCRTCKNLLWNLASKRRKVAAISKQGGENE